MIDAVLRGNERELGARAGHSPPEVPILLQPNHFVESARTVDQAAAVRHRQHARGIEAEEVAANPRRVPCLDLAFLGAALIEHVKAEDEHDRAAAQGRDSFQVVRIELIVIVEVGDEISPGPEKGTLLIVRR